MDEFHDRRRIQRIRFDGPIAARLGGNSVDLFDLSAEGASIEHSSPVKTATEVKLDLSFGEESVSVLCTVTRCRLQKRASGEGIYRTGLRFNDPKGGAASTLRRIIIDFITRDLEARQQHLDMPTE